jgi:hypothetical protein
VWTVSHIFPESWIIRKMSKNLKKGFFKKYIFYHSTIYIVWYVIVGNPSATASGERTQSHRRVLKIERVQTPERERESTAISVCQSEILKTDSEIQCSVPCISPPFFEWEILYGEKKVVLREPLFLLRYIEICNYVP